MKYKIEVGREFILSLIDKDLDKRFEELINEKIDLMDYKIEFYNLNNQIRYFLIDSNNIAIKGFTIEL